MDLLHCCKVLFILCSSYLKYDVFANSAEPHGFKLKSFTEKFILTSTFIGEQNEAWLSQSENQHFAHQNCANLQVYLPDMYNPIHLCVKPLDLSQSAFHKDFRLKVAQEGGTMKIIRLKDFNKTGFISVTGHVQGFGVSYVNGYIKDGNFYGMILLSHVFDERILMCAVTPMTAMASLKPFVDLASMDDIEVEEMIVTRTVKASFQRNANAIVSCGDRNDYPDVESLMRLTGFPTPTNVIIRKTEKETSGRQRVKRDPPPPPPADIGPEGPDASEPIVMETNGTGSGQTAKPENFVAKLLKKKNETLYVNICYILDINYLKTRFHEAPEQATVFIGNFVGLADWILRSTDFNKDGVPDNIGVSLLEVTLQPIKREIKSRMGDEWGRKLGGMFMPEDKAFKIVKIIGDTMHKNCDVRSAIGEVNSGAYDMQESGGCTACKTQKLTSFTSPYSEHRTPRAEYLRMLYHQVRLVAFAYITDSNMCYNCTTSMRTSRISKSVGKVKKASRDGCMLEGVFAERSNLHLTTFRLSQCSINEAVKCFKTIAGRPDCIKRKQEDSYCGNGIVEGDEECDCGTIISCAEQRCVCSPRNGLTPCRWLRQEDQEICHSLIKCRGFNFISEYNEANGSLLADRVSNLLSGSPEDSHATSDANDEETPRIETFKDYYHFVIYQLIGFALIQFYFDLLF